MVAIVMKFLLGCATSLQFKDPWVLHQSIAPPGIKTSFMKVSNNAASFLGYYWPLISLIACSICLVAVVLQLTRGRSCNRGGGSDDSNNFGAVENDEDHDTIHFGVPEVKRIDSIDTIEIQVLSAIQAPPSSFMVPEPPRQPERPNNDRDNTKKKGKSFFGNRTKAQSRKTEPESREVPIGMEVAAPNEQDEKNKKKSATFPSKSSWSFESDCSNSNPSSYGSASLEDSASLSHEDSASLSLEDSASLENNASLTQLMKRSVRNALRS